MELGPWTELTPRASGRIKARTRVSSHIELQSPHRKVPGRFSGKGEDAGGQDAVLIPHPPLLGGSQTAPFRTGWDRMR